MVSVEWIVAAPPPRPTVFATVKAGEWQMTAETTHDNVTLAVLENTLLMLICMAGYPILWHKENETDPQQSRTYNPFLESKGPFGANVRTYSNSNEYEIPAIDKYESVIRIRNFSAATAGIYTCKSARFNMDVLRTTVQLDVKTAPPNNSTHAEIIQGCFDYVRPQPAYFFRYWSTKLSSSFIYSIPPNATVTQAFETNDPSIEWAIEQPQWGDKARVFLTGDFIELETKLLSPLLGETIFTVTRGSYFHKGDCYFILRTHLGNKTVIEKRERFFLWLDTIEYSVEAAEALTPLNASTLLSIGQVYEVRVYVSNSTLTNVRLLVQQQDLHPEGCTAAKVQSNMASETCGVYGFSLFNDTRPSASETGVRVFLHVKESCILTVLLRGPGQASEPLPSLYIAALDQDVFGTDRSGAVLISEPNESNTFTNESITLRCLMPKCHLFYIVWCADWCQWPPFKYNNEGPRMQGQMADARISFTNYSAHTVSSDAYFPSLQENHTGNYYCGLLAPSSRKQHIVEPPPVELRLSVKDPIPPKFLDGQDLTSVRRSFKRGATLPLLCRVTALPDPRITWTRKLDSGEISDIREEFQDNSTLEIDQPGTYICNTTNKYGTNSRTFLVQYDAEISYLPFAIAIPAAILIFVSIALLCWWLRRRAIEASFKELAKTLKNSSEIVPLDDSSFLNDQVQFLQYNRAVEIDRGRFSVSSKLLGVGEFGMIYKADLKLDDSGSIQEVAIKLPRDSLNLQQYRSLADELKIMSHIRPHVNVLSLVGACTQNLEKRELFMLTEYCENGSLRDYLIKNFMKFEGFEVNAAGQFLGVPGAVEALLKYAYQAANGMAYLAAEKILHRDLALRNLLLTGNHIVKIADFGMSRQNTTNAVYRKRLSVDVPVPIFWMALESLANGQYTKTSDVWSFGVVLWEMFSCGKRPYPNHEPNAAFRTWLMEKEENRMGPPKIACDEIYQLMRSCWREYPDARPSFSECKRIISRILEQRSPSMYQSMVVTLSDAWLTMTPNARSNVSDAGGTSAPPDAIVRAYISTDDSTAGPPKNDVDGNGLLLEKKMKEADENKREEEIELQSGMIPVVPHVTGSDPMTYTTFSKPDTPYNFCKIVETL